MCLLIISEETATLPYTTPFVTEMVSVYCAVRTHSWYKTDYVLPCSQLFQSIQLLHFCYFCYVHKILIEWKTAIIFTYGIRLMCKRKFSTMLSADDQVMLWSLRRSQMMKEKLMSQNL